MERGSDTVGARQDCDHLEPDWRTGIEAYLAQARRGLRRMTPRQALAACADGWLLVDTRTDRQRREQGALPGAVVIDLTVLEWRLDPRSDSRIAAADSYDLPVIVVCSQGYSSSLAAARLRAIGLHRATDMIDGVEGWQRAGLPLIGTPQRTTRRWRSSMRSVRRAASRC